MNEIPSNSKSKDYTLDLDTLQPDWNFGDVESYNTTLPAIIKVVKGSKNITT
jgi:hypothetical protein